MRILDNGIAVLENDQLSKWATAWRDLSIPRDTACYHNVARLHPGDWVIDAGAALGDHTVAYLKKVGPTGRVIAFEPNPEYFECLSHNCPTAELHQWALGEKTAVAKLNLNRFGNTGASFLGATGDIDVPVRALDDLRLERLHLFKLDIEGWEWHALKGASRTIRTFRPIIQLEWNIVAMGRTGVQPQKLRQWFDENNYRAELLEGNWESGAEVMAFPKEKP